MKHSNKNSKLMEILETGSQRYIKADILAASALREAIIKGALPPGQEIPEEMIAQHLNISRMPVRQALGILEAEGLVERSYRKGTIVTELSASELEELYNIRAYVEGLAIKKAVPNYNANHIRRLRDCFAEFGKNSEDPISYFELNNKFHALLYELCDWELLLGLITQLRNNCGRYMIIAHESIIRKPFEGTRHSDILAVCEEGDADKAEDIIRNHIFHAMEALLRNMNETQKP